MLRNKKPIKEKGDKYKKNKQVCVWNEWMKEHHSSLLIREKRMEKCTKK